MSDVRKGYISQCAVNILGVELPPANGSVWSATATALRAQVEDAREVSRFLEDPTCFVLQIAAVQQGGQFALSVTNGSEVVAGSEGAALFTKCSAEPIADSNVHKCVLVSHVQGSPLVGLHSLLHNVYSPLLCDEASPWFSRLDSKSRGLMLQVESALSSAAHGAALKLGDGGEQDLSNILTPADECRHWEVLANRPAYGADPAAVVRAQEVWQALEPLAEQLDSFAELGFGEALELLDALHDALDAMHDALCPEKRMVHLMRVVGSAVDGYVKRQLGGLDLWRAPYMRVARLLKDSSALAERWTTVCLELTTLFWPKRDNPWRGGPFRDGTLESLVRRLDEVLRLRVVHQQVTAVLDAGEAHELGVGAVFDAFARVNALHHSDFSKAKWATATAAYQRAMDLIELRVADKLRPTLSASSARPQALLREFLHYRELIGRPNISRALAPEREMLLAQLEGHLASLRDDFDARTGVLLESASAATTGGQVGKNLTGVVQRAVLTRSLLARTVEMAHAADSLMADLQGAERFRAKAEDLKAYLDDYGDQQFHEWCEEVERTLVDESQGLQLQGKLMVISSDDASLVVNFSERLVQFLREVRQLSAVGFSIPKGIAAQEELAKGFYARAVALRQVANTYNKLDAEVVRSQKPLLLNEVLRFERIATNPTSSSGSGAGKAAITWADKEEVDRYTRDLHEARERLQEQIRKLRRTHLSFGDEVQRLMGLSLLHRQDEWKRAVDELRRRANVMEPHFPGMKQWRNHWDVQLYKALEVQYRAGLETLHATLPPLDAELQFKSRQLTFKPPIEDLKTLYFKKVKEFISVPTKFKGLQYYDEAKPGASGGEAGGQKLMTLSVFREMPDRCVDSLVEVYRQAAAVFHKLDELAASLEPWVGLGRLHNVDEFVQRNCTNVSEWEANYSALKARRKESDKLPNVFKVDCVTVSLVPFKAALDDQYARVSGALAGSMKAAFEAQRAEVEAFVREARGALHLPPAPSYEQIFEARQARALLKERMRGAEDTLRELSEKSKLLSNAGGSSSAAPDLGPLRAEWDELDVSVEAFDGMVAALMADRKAGISERVAEGEKAVANFAARWFELKPKSIPIGDAEAMRDVGARLTDLKAEFDAVERVCAQVADECEHFEQPPPHFEKRDEVRADLESFTGSLGLIQEFSDELAKLSVEDWISFRGRLWEFDDFVAAWVEKAKACPAGPVAEHLREVLRKLRDVAPNLKLVRGDGFEAVHWSDMFRRLGVEKVDLSKLTLGHFVRVAPKIVEHADELKALISRASGEVSLREALNEVSTWSQDTSFTLTEFTERGRTTPLIKEWKDLTTQVSDMQSLLGSLKESAWYAPFADEVQGHARKLTALDDCLASLNVIQRKWVYLEPIFGRGAMPHEAARFERVDTEFRSLLLSVADNPRVLSILRTPNLPETLATIQDQLERCQKALADFLEDKRQRFPRFYFIGDDDLLEILGQAKNPEVIQTHLKKLFAGIHKVAFADENRQIVGMCSLDGELVPLTAPVTVSDQVETWLSALSDLMRSTLADELATTLRARETDLQKMPQQVLLVSEMITFTHDCEAALSGGGGPLLQKLRAGLLERLQEYTQLETDSALVQTKLKAMLLDLIHNMDVVDQLLAARAASPLEWHWRKQLRYYAPEQARGSGACTLTQVDASFDYTFEYQGNAPKLVHTPLTDKCYITLTQAMYMGYGGNPYGPAGTGKTESVKALGQAFGRQVLVFNCDEGIDSQSMGRIFVGLVKCGAWGCFDEFNRLLPDQLSEISQQIQLIQFALKARQPQVELLGVTVKVDSNAGIFVTMNPAGKGYGGRSKLPDNLKALFRAIAMSAPDNELIAEVMMYSEGFTHAKELGSKLVAVFKLSAQLLSPQQHYDWGLRSLKTVLRVAGQLVYAEKKKVGGKAIPRAAEESAVIKALRINTLSKLTYSDTEAFNALIGDVFPGASVQDITYDEIEAAIRAVLAKEGLQPLELQVKKMLQFYEATQQRMGVVIVGPSGSGKTVICQVLRQALQSLGRRIPTYTMNPKAMPREQLLGKMDHDTREWADGVLTASSRKVVKEDADVRSWIMCDGDIDPEWIESLNSVLDDNHLLTMPSGERIQFGPNVNFIFETHDLKFASPATVTRMGMIFLSEESTEVECIVQSWLATLEPELQARMDGWISDHFYRAYRWVLEVGQTHGGAALNTTKAGIVKGGLSHLHGVRTKGAFVAALVRGLGSNLLPDKRTELAKMLYQWAGETPADRNRPLESYFDERTGGHALYALDLSAPVALEELHSATGPMVLTAEVQRDTAMLMPWLERMEPFILVGPEGCGKNMLLSHAFAKLRGAQVAVVHCSAQTKSWNVIQKLTQVCASSATQAGRIFRPKEGSRLILFLKDINLPKPDKYETSELVEFLQQLVTYNGFYDKQLEWVGLEKVQIVCSINPASTLGRYPLSSRFTASVRIACVSYPDRDALTAIYGQLCALVLRASCEGSAEYDSPAAAKKLAACMVEVYESVRRKFSPDEQRHYQYSPRELTRWVRGLLRYDMKSPGATLLDTWAHEGARLLRDRLVDPHAHARFDALLAAAVRTHFNKALDEDSGSVYTTFAAAPGEAIAKAGQSARALPLRRTPRAEVLAYAERGLQLYEREVKELSIQLFPEALEHVLHFERVISQAAGHLLLVGRSGVGRRSLVTLAAHMHDMPLFSPCVTRDYGVKQFRVDLKAALSVAGVQGRHVVLLVEDYQLAEPAFIEMVNSLLSSGEISGLYTPEELEPLLAPLKEEMAAAGTHRSLYDFFVSRCAAFCHVVLSLDPTNDKFAMRCESNPALFTRCALMWMGSWGSTSMATLPARTLAEAELPAELHGAITKNLVALHESQQTSGALDRGAVPRNYVSMIGCWGKIYKAKRDELSTRIQHLGGGLAKLNDAAKAVDTLSKAANEQRAKLADAQKLADVAMVDIQGAMEQALERKKEVEGLQKSLGVEEQEMSRVKVGIETELAHARPLLEAAQAAVGGIRSDNLAEIRSLKMPPDAIRDVLEGVLRIMGNYDTSWISMKRFLSNKSVKDEILNFDSRKITPEVRESVNALLRQKGASFEEATIRRVSVAAAPLAAWVRANIEFSTVLHRVAPLEAQNEELVYKLGASKQRLVDCQEQLGSLDGRVKGLKQNFQQKTAEAEGLKLSLDRAETTLSAALQLIEKLGGERGRWDRQLQELTAELRRVPHKAMMAAAFITYLADEEEATRAATIARWGEVLGAGAAGLDFSLQRFLSSEGQLLSWKAQGLPGDTLSMDNALVIEYSRCVPFIIDPSSQATSWLVKHLQQGATVETVTPNEQRFSTALELSVRFGKTCVVQEVDTIEAVLVPIVRRDLLRQGPRWVVQVGEKQIDYNDSFRLILATRNQTPLLPPDSAALVTLVNFSVTRGGLEGQLLGLTIQHEQPELESQKSALLAAEEELKVHLEDLERLLLNELATSTGNILENKALLESLNETKAKSNTISEKLKQSTELQVSLDRQRDVYRPVAVIGSAVFFALVDLRRLSHMYQFSLPGFLRLFKASLAAPVGGGGGGAQERIKGLAVDLQQRTYQAVARSLIKEDRLTFALHLARSLAPHEFAEADWSLFTRKQAGGMSGSFSVPGWVPADRKADVALLSTTLPQLVQESGLASNPEWAQWMGSPSPETMPPRSMPSSVRRFQFLLLLQALRPERLGAALTSFACDLLRLPNLGTAPSSLQHVAAEGNDPTQPILMITTAGVDPSAELEDLASRVMPGRFKPLAMGGQQTGPALQLVREGAQRGDWVCLKNLHLVVGWVPALAKELSSLTPHPEFRLWLTTEAHPSFSPIVLQASLKVTFEAPPGLQRNLMRTYETWAPEYVETGSVQRAQTLFVLAWFHALIQERRTYIPQGWSKFYEFSSADLRSAADLLAPAAGQGSGALPDLEMVHGLLGTSVYGGRLETGADKRVLDSYMRQYFTGELIAGRGGARALGGVLQMPQSARHADFVRAIAALPPVDSPALFGLALNADRAVASRTSSYVIKSLRTLSTAAEGAAAFERERWSAELSPLLTLWQKQLQQNDLLKLASAGASAVLGVHLDTPVHRFVALERKKAAALVEAVDGTLSSIARVVRGAELLTASTQADGATLLALTVPSAWADLWEGPPEPAAWIRAAVARTVGLAGWWQRIEQDALLGSPLVLAELLSPSNLLNALRQQTARAAKCSIDSLRLSCALEAAAFRDAPAPPVQVHSLLLQGALMSPSGLSEAPPDAPFLNLMPPLFVAWIPANSPDPYPAERSVSLTVYLDTERERTLAELILPCAATQTAWIQAGAALFVSGEH
ncbi:dynein heavy chain and region D6 of dynein motor-domain-containing protein [Pavlovales sp. CCMP2436]|nr:dynein heavy chain and region D6 of dynein motor-domain-containing protein [Pavlovales sp. CCMP2436]